MQMQDEVGKWVTDGTHTYPYNAFLDELLNNGKLHFCEKPKAETKAVTLKVPKRTPLTMTPDERAALAAKLSITVGELGNMSPQELQEAEAQLEADAKIVETDGFPKG